MWIKICGMTSIEAVQAAVSAGADAVGFVFAPSVRRVDAARAHVLAAPARGRALCVAVTRHPSQDEVDEILSVLQPDALQSDADDFERLRLPRDLPRLPVLRAGAAPPEPLPPRCLFEGPASGAGATSDWVQAARLARQTELVLAGGLHAGNVAAAIRHVAPYGLDVSSGVEERPGVKSSARIESFVRAARAALQETQ
jgi:phosphoribosylanthranilate isomerase